MTSNKLSSRRAVAQAPHVCHPPPPIVIPPGAPAGTYWMIPAYQVAGPYQPVGGDIHAECDEYSEEDWFDVTYKIPYGEMTQGWSIQNGTTEIWEWDTDAPEGDYQVEATIKMGDVTAAIITVAVRLEEEGPIKTPPRPNSQPPESQDRP